MIPVKQLLVKLDLKLNKSGTSRGQNVSKYAKIIALREACLRVFKKKVSVNNLFQLGFDAFKSRYEELQSFVVSQEKLSATKTDEVNTSYSVDLSTLSKKYFMAVEIQAIADRGPCKDRVINIPKITKHFEVQTTLDNLLYGPTFDGEESVAKISGDKLIVYANDPAGDFVIKEVRVSYLRYPAMVDFPGIKHVDGSVGQLVDSDFPDILEDEILEMAILELGINTGNLNAAEGALKKSKEAEL